ncbi:hypothetical protein ACH4VX_23505 [Streptomyces sp. NPDC020731]|uniref:hypothetical protein n=1 Tax=Streptomyces sp. NPDC020731 TaxID=3365085 RepID=UPI00379ADD5E
MIVGRRRERLGEFAASHPEAGVRPVAAGLSTDAGIDTVAGTCAADPLTVPVNNARVAHCMPLDELPADKATERVNVEVLAPTIPSASPVSLRTPGRAPKRYWTAFGWSGGDRPNSGTRSAHIRKDPARRSP